MLVKQEEYAKLPHRNKLENNKKNIGFFREILGRIFESRPDLLLVSGIGKGQIGWNWI